jgi:predicted Ser/Thr protein kinase
LPSGNSQFSITNGKAYRAFTSSLWLNDRVLSFVMDNNGVYSANLADTPFFNYSIATDNKFIIHSFEAVPNTDGSTFKIRVSASGNSYLTVLYDCTTTDCTRQQAYENCAYSTLAVSTDRWAMCMKVGDNIFGYLAAGNYTCVSSADPSTQVLLPNVTRDYPIDQNTGDYQLRSCLIRDSVMVLAVTNSVTETYTIYALDSDRSFALIANSVAKGGKVRSITCQDAVVLVATNLGFDYYVYDNGSGIVFPPILVPTTAPAASPSNQPSSTNTPTSTESPSRQTQSPVAAPLDVTGIAAGSAVGGAALIAGAVLTGVFVSRYMRRKKQKKSDEESPTTPMVPLHKDDPEFDKKMQIPFKELVIKKMIGSGSFGKVYIGKWRGSDVAIKVNNMIQDTKGFLDEAKLTLSMPPHPNLVQTFGVSIDSNHPCIVLEFCDGGSLDKIVFNHRLNVDEQRALVKGVAFGLAHLHSHKIVHRDLAVRNILLDKGIPKISDFGMSRVLSEEAEQGKTNTTVGPVRWMAPESIIDMTYSVKSDVWTFGIVALEIVSGHEPHEGENQLDVARKIKDTGYAPTIAENCDPVLKELMEMCWKFDPAERPDMEHICEFLSQRF